MASEIHTQITNSAKDSVGYNEAVNKDSFMIGASVAASRAETIYEAKIKELETSLTLYKGMSENAHADFITLSKILRKYDEE